AESLGRLEIDDEFERHGPLNRQVGGPGAFQDSGGERSDASVPVGKAWAVRHETTCHRVLSKHRDCRKPPRGREIRKSGSKAEHGRRGQHHHALSVLPGCSGKSALDIVSTM